MDPYKVVEIPVKEIHPAKGNRAFGELEVKGLQASIKEMGLINPILVEKNGDGYIVVAGHRRLAACQKLKWDSIPASVIENSTNEIRIVDNIQRSDLHPMDEAVELETLLEKLDTVKAVAAAVGKSTSYVYSRLRLANLCEGARESYKNGSWSHDVFMELARLTEEQQKKMLTELGNMWNATGADAKRRIQELFFMKLTDAPFDIKNPNITEAGSCVDCPKRASNDEMLFDDIVTTDTCTDHVCWKNKRMKNYNQQVRALKDAGEEIHLLSDEDWNVAIDKIKASKWKLSKKSDKDAKKGLIAAGYHKGKIVYFTDLRTKTEIKSQTPEGVKAQREKKRKGEVEDNSITREHRDLISKYTNQPLKDFLNEKYLEGNKKLQNIVLSEFLVRALQFPLLNDHYEIGLDLEGFFDHEDRNKVDEWLEKNMTKELFDSSIYDIVMKNFVFNSHTSSYYGELTGEAELARSLGFDPDKAIKEGRAKADLEYATKKVASK